MNSSETEEVTTSPLGVEVLEEIQAIFVGRDLKNVDAICVCAELLVWTLLNVSPDLAEALKQLDAMQEGFVDALKANYPSIAARRAVIRDIEHGGGGWIN